MKMPHLWLTVLLLLSLQLKAKEEQLKSVPKTATASATSTPDRFADLMPCKAILVPSKGTEKIDQEIARLQSKIKDAPDPVPFLDRLGWVFVSKARLTQDSSFYKLAQSCAECIEARQPKSFEAMLLRGHILHHSHSFKEAETLARTLSENRGAPFDFGLLGDVLIEQGRVAEAINAYQQMIDLRPDLQSYCRAAHARWITGDLDGAREMAEMAAEAGSSRDPESAAWALSTLAFYQWQLKGTNEARQNVNLALQLVPNHAAALFAKARIDLASNDITGALTSLKRACAIKPELEYQWLLADVLQILGREKEAQKLEEELNRNGVFDDARTFALYLTTRGIRSGTAVNLARRELSIRSDVLTHDALAWALWGANQNEEAEREMEKALAEKTPDARLFLHAAIIADALGKGQATKAWLEKLKPLQHTLFPSEKQHLQKLGHRLAEAGDKEPRRGK
ncbi:MAG: tetratricopeptide repeat protein [Verrucomicrobia bacterium]|nr:tetratricopeptide repeat protein [Verrucomicrobiota bacterium]